MTTPTSYESTADQTDQEEQNRYEVVRDLSWNGMTRGAGTQARNYIVRAGRDYLLDSLGRVRRFSTRAAALVALGKSGK